MIVECLREEKGCLERKLPSNFSVVLKFYFWDFLKFNQISFRGFFQSKVSKQIGKFIVSLLFHKVLFLFSQSSIDCPRFGDGQRRRGHKTDAEGVAIGTCQVLDGEGYHLWWQPENDKPSPDYRIRRWNYEENHVRLINYGYSI